VIAVLVTFRIRPECIEAFKAELLKVKVPVVAEPECLGLDYAQDAEDPTRFLLYENWPSREYFEKTQLQKPYYRPYLDATQPMWAEPRRFTYFNLFSRYQPCRRWGAIADTNGESPGSSDQRPKRDPESTRNISASFAAFGKDKELCGLFGRTFGA